MSTYDVKNMNLRELIKAYGDEREAGGAGATRDDSEELMAEIEKVIATAEEDGGGAL
jgi:hypothetical protein